MSKLIYMTEKSEENPSIGVWKKIEMQLSFFRSEGFYTSLYNINKEKNNKLHKKILKRLPFVGLYNWKIDKQTIKETDCIYIRYPKCDYQMIQSLKNMKKQNQNLKIIVEIPTYPYDNESRLTLANVALKLKDKWNRRKLNKYVDYILTYSKDKFIFNIPTLKISNAVDTSNINLKRARKTDGTINVIAVAKFAFWHGYDRFIKGMYQYYNSSIENKTKIILHMVGEGDELSNYISLVDYYGLNDLVFFYGNKKGTELDRIYDECELALDAMGRHRTGVYYNSTLKGKEYGAKGLPIISGVETEFDSIKDYKYYMRVPADESHIDMGQVIDFYHKVYCSTNQNKNEIICEIREHTKKNFDVSVVWQRVANLIK